MTSKEKVDQLESDLLAASNEVTRLRNLIGQPPEGSHPDEWTPRDATWHKERQNWIAEMEHTRGYKDTAVKLLEQVLIDFRSFDKSGIISSLKSVSDAEAFLEARKPRPV